MTIDQIRVLASEFCIAKANILSHFYRHFLIKPSASRWNIGSCQIKIDSFAEHRRRFFRYSYAIANRLSQIGGTHLGWTGWVHMGTVWRSAASELRSLSEWQ